MVLLIGRLIQFVEVVVINVWASLISSNFLSGLRDELQIRYWGKVAKLVRA